MREKKKWSRWYAVIKWIVKTCYPKIEVVGQENLPDEPVIVVGNHCQMNGPIAGELYMPGYHYIWCAGEMMHFKEVPGYAFQDFWSQKPKWTHPFYRLLSYIITPLSVCVFNNAHTIGVYHDTRILSTFKNTVKRLQEGASVVVFPEHDVKHNNIIYDFQDKFIDIAKLYYKKTGKELAFVPLYIAPKQKKMYFGKAVRFCAAEPMDAERSRICRYLMDAITTIAQNLPEHKVVPYKNIPRKDYPSNIPETVKNMEIRRFQPADAADTARLIAETLTVTNGKDYSEAYLQKIIAAYSAKALIMQAERSHMYVACDGGKIVGCGAAARYEERPDESILLSIFVQPAYQGKGIGRSIMEALEQDEYCLQSKRIELHASITAVEFYKKLGYACKDGNAQLDDRLLYKLEKFR